MRIRQALLASGAAFAVVIATIGTAAAEPGQTPGSESAASGGPSPQSVTAAVSTGKGPLSPRLQEIAAAGPRTAAGLRSAVQAAGVPESAPFSLALGPEVSVEVTIRVAAVSDETRQALTVAGAQITVVSDATSSYSAHVAPQALNRVAAVPGVIAVSEVLQTRRPDPGMHGAAPESAPAVRANANACAPTTSLADTQLKAALARTNFGVDGTGIKVGVISISYAATTSPTSAAQDVASGNLPGTGNPCGYPAPVQVLSDNPSGSDEGRAMLQLVHKVAPGATLMFAKQEADISGSIRALQAAGANVIVDDTGNPYAPMFQAGPVDKAISDVTALGVTYLAAAGNYNQVVAGRDVGSVELSSFRAMACPDVVAAFSGVRVDSCMDFAPSAPQSNTASYTISPGASIVGTMGYSEPLYGVTDDLDMFMLSADGQTILDHSSQDSIAVGVPNEVLFTQNTSDTPMTVKFVVSRQVGSGTPRTKIIAMLGHDGLTAAEYTTSSGPMTVGPSIMGHNGGPDTFSIAATDGSGAGTTPERFSSRGPLTYYWGPFTTAATPATAIPAAVLNKPDVTSTDGDCTTFFEGPPPTLPNCPYQFYGTSGAAPNAAGVAALVLSRNKTLTPAQVKAIMVASAAPMPGGSLFSTGAGLLDANAAVGLAFAPAPTPTPVPAPAPAAVGQAQGPLTGCVTVPNSIPARGKRKLERAHCLTNAGQLVTVAVTGRLRGDAALWKVIRKKNGKVFIQTYGRHLKLRITWTAPATAAYAAYTFTRTYRT